MYFRAVNDFQGVAPSWTSDAQAAVSMWNSQPGPQFYSFNATSGDTLIYMDDSYSGQDGVSSNTWGLTYNCKSTSSGTYCSDSNTTMNVAWSNLYFNHDLMDPGSSEDRQNAFAHESGHAMGLFHSQTSGDLMFATHSTTTVASTADIGTYPACSNGEGGLRCVYGDGAPRN